MDVGIWLGFLKTLAIPTFSPPPFDGRPGGNVGIHGLRGAKSHAKGNENVGEGLLPLPEAEHRLRERGGWSVRTHRRGALAGQERGLYVSTVRGPTLRSPRLPEGEEEGGVHRVRTWGLLRPADATSEITSCLPCRLVTTSRLLFFFSAGVAPDPGMRKRG